MAVGLVQAAFGLYAAATVLYCGYVVTLRDAVATWARRLLLGAFAVHLVADVTWIADLGSERLVGTFGALPLATWVLVGGYVLLDWRVPLRLLGAFVAPTAAFSLLLCALVHPDVRPVGPQLSGLLRNLHVSLAFLGAAALVLACGVAVLYLVLEVQLKRKRLSRLVRHLPSLETLDRVNYRCVTIGFPLYTAALVLGGVWAARLVVVGWQPQHTVAVLGWVAFGVLLQARLMAGWRGRRAALLTIAGSSLVLVVLLSYALRGAGGP